MIRILSILLISIFFLDVKGQFPDTALIRTFGSNMDEYGHHILSLYNGDYLITGTTASMGNGNTDIYLVKVDSNGIYKWSRTYGKANIEWGIKSIFTKDSCIVTLGFTNSYGNGGYDILILKTDTLGDFIWEKNIGWSDWDFGYDIKQLPDSTLIICGATYSQGNGNRDALIVKTTGTGDTLWTKTIGNSGEDNANSLCVFLDNSIYITGEIETSLGNKNIFITKYDENGNKLWQKNYSNLKNTFSNSIIPTNDNGIIIAGKTDSINSGNWDIYLVKADSSGIILWEQIFSHSGEEYATDIIQLPDNGFIVCANTNSFGSGGFGVFLLRIDQNGYWISSPTFGGVFNDFGFSTTRNINGNIAFLGETESYGFGRKDIYLIIIKNDNVVMDYTLSSSFYNDTTSIVTNSKNSINTNNDNFKIFPIPASNILYLSLTNDETYEVSIFELNGKLVYRDIINDTSNSIHSLTINEFSNGIYFLNLIKVKDGHSHTIKFIIDK